MASTWFSVVVDCKDPRRLAEWWALVLGFEIVHANEREVDIAKDGQSFPGISFLRVSAEKAGKNRLHFDLNPDDQAAEVARLLAMGARHVNIGQGQGREWVVLADPEDNEFCVLAPQRAW